MELIPCCFCSKSSKCHIQSAFIRFVSENNSIMTFRFKCTYFDRVPGALRPESMLKQSSPCQECSKSMNCHTKRQMCDVLSTFSGIVSDVCFACKNKRTKHNPRMDLHKSCLTENPDFDCANCQVGYQCPQQGIRQLHTEPGQETTVVNTMEWVDLAGSVKIIVATRDKSLFPHPWSELEQ